MNGIEPGSCHRCDSGQVLGKEGLERTEDELRRSLFDALFENRVFVAERKVPADKVRE